MTTMNERPIRILSVEDSENDFRLAMRQLRKSGFAPEGRRVQDLPSLQQALQEGPWDAVISDFSMPGFSGLQALAEFRARGLDIPFIFVSGTIGEEMAVAAMRADTRTALLPTVILTSSKEEQDVVAGYSLGANSYVRKPVDFAEFLEAVKILGIYWLALNQVPPPQ